MHAIGIPVTVPTVVFPPKADKSPKTPSLNAALPKSTTQGDNARIACSMQHGSFNPSHFYNKIPAYSGTQPRTRITTGQ